MDDIKILLILFCIFWIAGWLRQLAGIRAISTKTGAKLPDGEVAFLLPVVLFFAWPYFYFYEREL